MSASFCGLVLGPGVFWHHKKNLPQGLQKEMLVISYQLSAIS